MSRKLIILLLLCNLVVTGCALPVFVAGAGTGACVYTYMRSAVKRTYQASYDETIEACMSSLKSLNIKITEKASGGIETIIKGKRPKGTSVNIKVEMIASRISEVSIRTGLVGVWDKNVSKIIHATIDQKIDQKT